MANILLIGDSITEAFPHSTLLRGHTVVNRGVYGDNTRLVLKRLEKDVLREQCDAVFLLIGTNDMASGFSNGETITNIDLMLKQIAARAVSRTVYVQSILPTRSLPDRPIDRIEFLNYQIRRVAKLHSAHYLDIGSLFVNSNGEIAEEYSTDGLHLTEEGYTVWGKHLQGILTGELKR